MQPDLSKRAYVVVTVMAVTWIAIASLHGIADVWLWGHNGFNGAAFFNAARNSLRFGVVGQALYHYETRPPHPASLYTHHPLLMHFHLIAMMKVFGISEWAARAVPAFYSVVDVLLVAWVTRRHWDRRMSAIATTAYVLTPLNLIFANMVDHEQGSIAFLLIGLDGVVSWLSQRRHGFIAQACLGFAVAAQWDWPAYPIAFLLFCIVLWRARRALRPELRFLVPFALTMLTSIGAFFAWIWKTHGSLADMRASLALRTSPVDGYAARLFERSLDLYGPMLMTLFAVGLVLLVRRPKAPRDLIVVAFFLGQVFHTVVFRQAGFIHAYWTWHANPAVAIAVAEVIVAGLALTARSGHLRPAIAVLIAIALVQTVFAVRQFQWGYATGSASYAFGASDTDQRDENLWAREVARTFGRDGTRYWLSESIYRRRTELDVQLDAPMLAGEAYAHRQRVTMKHEVALLDLNRLPIDAESLTRLDRVMAEHATRVWDDHFVAIDFAAPPATLRRYARREVPSSWLWRWLHQPFAHDFVWEETAGGLTPRDTTPVSGEHHGGTSGVPFGWTCFANGHVTAIDATYDAGRLTALRPRCDTGEGPWVGGRFVVRPTGLVGWLIGHPRRPLPTRTMGCPDGAPLRDLTVVADRTVRDVTPVCDGDRVVVGLRGHYGDLVDGVAVQYAQ